MNDGFCVRAEADILFLKTGCAMQAIHSDRRKLVESPAVRPAEKKDIGRRPTPIFKVKTVVEFLKPEWDERMFLNL